jgi:NADH-quinone oxidoreductase subunit L
MVTAGVYLIARMHPLFVRAPDVLLVVALIGSLTLLLAGASALVQKDIKRVLAYSTMSQVGYMFLALGVGAWSAAIFHFVTHAFFKALLFLSAGVVIRALDDEHDIFRMGGLRRRLPLAFWTFLIAAASLSALPFVTAGFYSKEPILRAAWLSARGGAWLWIAGVAGAFLTSIYSFRVVFVAFLGPDRTIGWKPPLSMTLPLMVLAVFSLGGGLVPALFGNPAAAVLPAGPAGPVGIGVQAVAALIPVAGIGVAVLLYLGRPAYAEALAAGPRAEALRGFLFSGWGFDRLYQILFVGPFLWLARVNRGDFIDFFFRALAWTCGIASKTLVATQSGKVRWYVAGIALGAALFIAMAVFL